MENIPPIPQPLETGQSDPNPNTCSTASPGSSLRSLPLLQQPTRSDCSAAQNSIGSSSDFNVRAMSRPENPLATVSDAAEPASPAVPRGHGPWDIADPPTELTPRADWVPADAVLEADPSPEYSNNRSVPEVTNDNQVSDVTNDSPVPEATNDSPVPEVTDESSAHVTFEDPVSTVINEGSNEPLPATISSNVSNSTIHSYAEIAGLKPPDEEIYRLRQIEDPRGKDWEVLDLPKTSRAKLYNYHISRVQKLRVLCDQGKVMTDLPVHSEEDYALLKALTRTNWGSRWWTIMVDDLKCPECVSLLKARRRDPKVR
jgi:hypothetical protein